jgi:hypothetical protein
MFALLITALTAIYLLGPGLIARWILGLFVSQRVIMRSRSEEITRAVLLAVFPLSVAISEATWRHVLRWRENAEDIKLLFSCIYSDASFQKHQLPGGGFYHAAFTFLWMNGAILWRLYAQIVFAALCFAIVAWQYGRIIRWDWVKNRNWILKILARVIRSRVSEWQLHLSPFALDRAASLQADVLTISGNLYQGGLESAITASDGRLAGLVLSNPFRFDRITYLQLKGAQEKPEAKDHWKTIPSETFIISGPDISTINVREVLPTDAEFVTDIERLLEAEPTELDEPPN